MISPANHHEIPFFQQNDRRGSRAAGRLQIHTAQRRGPGHMI
jgi:hypothetical protein